MDIDFNIDSHKLMFHPERVTKWLNGDKIYPIGVEVSLSNFCNHRCTFCALDYTEYKSIFMDQDVIIKVLQSMKNHGLKSVVFSGEGEPFAHKNAVEIINNTKKIGLDIGVSTNGALLSSQKALKSLPDLTWIRFSVAASDKEKYAKIHKTNERDFEKSIQNIEQCVQIKKKLGLNTTLGIQLILIPENVDDVIALGKLAKEIGVDYYTVKPYSKNPLSLNTVSDDFDYRDMEFINEKLVQLNSSEFKTFFRIGAMKKLNTARPYDKCYGHNFFIHISTQGNVTPCIAFIDNPAYIFGNIYETEFEDLWSNKSNVEETIYELGTSGCREICRSDEINNYLYQLKNPNGHVNFI